MTTPAAGPDPLDELRFALAEGDAEDTAETLRSRVMAAGLAARAAGRYVEVAPAISPVEAFRRGAGSLDALLAGLADDEWRAGTAVRGPEVQGLVGHLIGVELDFAAGLDAGVRARADHIESTQPHAEAQHGRVPADTLAEWRAAVDATLRRLAPLESDAAALAAPANLHTAHFPLGELLVARTFELWAHAEDIRRATGRAMAAPDTSSLQLMTELAVAMVPFGAARGAASATATGTGTGAGTGRTGRTGRSARIVLTGPGGGTWVSDLGGDGSAGPTPGPDGPVDVRIVIDAVDFCRLFANRMDPRTVAADVSGDRALATDVLVGLTALALD
jgi:uncharacterized protein (TIGR03083 family)